jgi:hypothetical protein
MKRSVRMLLIAAALGLALPSVQVQPVEAGGVFTPDVVCPVGSVGGNDGQFDCIIFGPGEGTLSVGSVWKAFPSEPNVWRVRVYHRGAPTHRNVFCGPGPTGFTAKIRTFEGQQFVVGHCWSRGS